MASMTNLRCKVLTLYRDVLRVARSFPDRSMGRKLRFNAKELLRLRQHETDAARIRTHVMEGYDVLRVYQVLQRDSELLTAITRKKRDS
uniref:Complex 1 LYR protein domain-containing protein n=1 Tax=Peronospora matthiolae TaxID=2874970 RepID=A0AAV1US79_9STRA